MIANTTTEKLSRPDYSNAADYIKTRGTERVDDILIDVARIPPEVVKDKSTREHPCPKCGGTTRFRVFNDGKGGAHCSHCFNQKNSDFLSTVGWSLDVDFKEACRLCAEYLGLVKPHIDDIIAAVCQAKGIPGKDSLIAYGAKPAKRGGEQVARVDVYNEKGEKHSYFDVTIEGKGWAKKGKGSGGVFLPGRLPKPGEQWLLTEGVKDAATLYSLGYLALGAWQADFSEKYDQLLAAATSYLFQTSTRRAPDSRVILRLLRGSPRWHAVCASPYFQSKKATPVTR